MEYTIVDVNSLKIKLLIILISLGILYSILYLVLTMLIPYNLTIRKQKDVLIRRLLFFFGLFSLFCVNLFFSGDYLIGAWRPNMQEDDMQTIVSSLTSFILIGCLASVLIYILIFWLSAKFLRGFIGYKPWTVFVSKGKKFGLF